jgi:hypothetical protein
VGGLIKRQVVLYPDEQPSQFAFGQISRPNRMKAQKGRVQSVLYTTRVCYEFVDCLTEFLERIEFYVRLHKCSVVLHRPMRARSWLFGAVYSRGLNW